MTLQFKPAETQDIAQILQLFKITAEKIKKKKVDHWQYWTNPPVEKIQWVEEGVKNNEFFFIQNLDKDTIGMVRIMKEDNLYWGPQEAPARYIHSLVITEPYNGQGLGKRIIDHIADKAKAEDCNYLRLDADAKNPKLCRYYEHLGFEKVGTKKLPLSTYNLYQKELQ